MLNTKSLAIIVSLACLPACTSGSWWQARLLSGADTKQAIELEESQDPKICVLAEGSGNYLGMQGLIKVLEVRGKNVSFQDCVSYHHRQIQPVVLP